MKINIHSIAVSLLGLLLLTTGCSNPKGKPKTNDLQNMKLNGPVKSIIEKEYLAVDKFGEVLKGDIEGHEQQNFSKNGFRTEELSFGPNDFVARRTIYNEKGERKESYDYAEDRSIEEKTEFVYNDDGLIVKENCFNSEGKIIRAVILKYNEAGEEVERSTYDENGNLDRKEVTNYNENGKIAEKKTYKSDGSLESRFTCDYNQKGDMTFKYYNEDGELTLENNYIYDENGNTVQENSASTGAYLNYTSKQLISYDDFGEVIKRTSYVNGDLKSETTYEFEFDQNKNWVKKTEFENRIPQEIIEREIQYY